MCITIFFIVFKQQTIKITITCVKIMLQVSYIRNFLNMDRKWGINVGDKLGDKFEEVFFFDPDNYYDIALGEIDKERYHSILDAVKGLYIVMVRKKDLYGNVIRICTQLYKGNTITKKDVLNKVKEDYPEYFEKKVQQKVTSKSETDYYVIIKEVEDLYWKKMYLEYRKCSCCGMKYKYVDIVNDMEYSNFCSKECYDKKQKLYEQELENKMISKYSNNIGSIYMITQKSTFKRYVGCTKNHVMFRWWQHISQNTNTLFHKELRKGILNEQEREKQDLVVDLSDWHFEVLAVVENIDKWENEQVLYNLEKMYIEQYNSLILDDGFNSINGRK